MLPKALLHRSIKLIIIDSITAVFRGEYTLSEAPRRSRDLRDVAFCLHKLSVKHGLWIICVNQVITILYDFYTFIFLVPIQVIFSSCQAISWEV